MNLSNHTSNVKKLLMGVFLLVLVGCTHSQTVPEGFSVSQQGLLKKCPRELPYDYGTTGSEMLRLVKDWSSQYHDCATRHNGIVEVIKGDSSNE